MITKGFSIGEAIKYGWNTFKANVWFFIGLVLLLEIIVWLPTIIGAVAKVPENAYFTKGILIAIQYILSIWLTLGFINVSLNFTKNGTARVSDLFPSLSKVGIYFVSSILYCLLMIAGFLLLVFPMVIWGLRYFFFGFSILDRNTGIVESLRDSAKITYGAKWDLLGLLFALWVVNVIGILCLLVGVFATFPLTVLAQAYVYRKLVQKTESVATTEPATVQVRDTTQEL